MDFDSVAEVFKKDLVLPSLLHEFGLPESEMQTDVFNALIRSIVGQQLSVKAAKTIYGRFLDLYEVAPTPEELIGVSQERLREAGLSNQKSNYVKNVAVFFKDNQLVDLNWKELSDQEIIDLLTQIKGVGVWTVQMLLMFTFERPDVFPVDDLGIRMGMKKLYKLNSDGKELTSELVDIAEKWIPFRTIGSKLIWLAKDSDII